MPDIKVEYSKTNGVDDWQNDLLVPPRYSSPHPPRSDYNELPYPREVWLSSARMLVYTASTRTYCPCWWLAAQYAVACGLRDKPLMCLSGPKLWQKGSPRNPTFAYPTSSLPSPLPLGIIQSQAASKHLFWPSLSVCACVCDGCAACIRERISMKSVW